MLWVILSVIYVVGWLVTATCIARAEALDSDKGPAHCHGRPSETYLHRDNCHVHHGSGCWRGDEAEPQTEVTYANVLTGLGWGLVWPIIAAIGGPAALVYYAANKKPPRELLEARIKQLEKEVGLGD